MKQKYVRENGLKKIKEKKKEKERKEYRIVKIHVALRLKQAERAEGWGEDHGKVQSRKSECAWVMGGRRKEAQQEGKGDEYENDVKEGGDTWSWVLYVFRIPS